MGESEQNERETEPGKGTESSADDRDAERPAGDDALVREDEGEQGGEQEDEAEESQRPSPYRTLSNPARDPDPTEWPDPYDKREDPRDPPDPDHEPFGEEPHPHTGSTSTSEPHPSKDPEAGDRWEGPKRDRLDD